MIVAKKKKQILALSCINQPNNAFRLNVTCQGVLEGYRQPKNLISSTEVSLISQDMDSFKEELSR